MRKLAIIMLCLQIGSMSILNAGIFGELFKIPALLEHLADHQTNDWNKFVSFFRDHYYGEESEDQDHAAFPFQKTNFSHSFLAIPCENQIASQVGFFSIPTFDIPRDVLITDMYEAKGVWQPPGL